MKLTSKDYGTLKTKEYIKANEIFFIFSGINQNSNNKLQTKQELANIKFNCYKIFNRTATKILNNSVYVNIKPTITGVTYFVQPTINYSKLSKQILFNKLEPLFIVLLTIKLNNKIYSPTQLKKINSLEYVMAKLSFYQLSITNLKSNLNSK